MQGLPNSEVILLDKLNEVYDDIKKFFPFTINVNRIDIINSIRKRLNNGYHFPVLSPEERKYMIIRELFIYKQLKDPRRFNLDILRDKFPDINQSKVNEELSNEVLKKTRFSIRTDLWCKYCANREICIDYFANAE